MNRNSGATVGHLPMENSRAIKFILDRGARVFATLTSTNYCVSPLVQDGLEIPCRVEIFMLPTVKNKELIDIFQKKCGCPLLWKRRFKHGRILCREKGRCIRKTINQQNQEINEDNQSGRKSGSIRSTSKASHKDIRPFFVSKPKTPTTKTTSTSGLAANGADCSKKPRCIELNDWFIIVIYIKIIRNEL